MVSSSTTEGGAQVLPAGVRRTIQSIREVVRNHSAADVYVALKENDMDPYETIQRLLNQDPFRLVQRRRDRRQESKWSQSSASEEARKTLDIETVRMPVKNNSSVNHDSQRVGTGRNVSSGASVELRVVRDSRIAQNARRDSNPAQSSTSTCKEIVFDKSLKSRPGHQKRRMDQLSSQALNVPTELQPGKVKNPKSHSYEEKEMLSEKLLPVSDSSQVQKKGNEPRPHSSDSPSSSVVGVYSSSSDPVHVPSSKSRPAANIGAIMREVRVLGPRRVSSEHPTKNGSSHTSPLPYPQLAQDDELKSSRSTTVVSRSDKSSQPKAPESVPTRTAGRPVSNNQHSGRSYQNLSHHKAAKSNKEWKPKSSVKPSSNCPGVIKAPERPVSPPADNPEDLKKEAVQMQDNMSRLNLSEIKNVIIAAHIHVSESDRNRLTFGSLGTQLGSLMNSVFTASKDSEELSTEPSESAPMSAPESSENDPAGQLKMADASVQSSGSSSPASGVDSDQQLYEKKESSSPQRPENYANVGLVRDSSPSYNSESLKQQETSELPSFSGYEPQMDVSYFHPVEETITGPGLPSPKEVMNTHMTNSIPASTISMVQQQHMAQMYPQMHASQFANLMPYRQFLPPVYVPPMPVPAYSNNPAYPHPSNGSSYMLMPGSNSHLTQSGVKYGMQQFKPVPSGTFPTGFENFTSPAGYAISTPGLVGSTEDASRLKYHDSPYVPNPQQADPSEIWMNPRDIPSLQSASYYNITGQTPPAAYLTSHSGHVSFNPAAAAAQSSHMQFQGMYHPPPQPNPTASPHPLGPTIGANVGLAASAAAAHVGAYQQPHMGHMNWTANF